MAPHRSERLEELARRVARLRPSHRDPEAFHVEKSELAHELRRLAAEVRQPGGSFPGPDVCGRLTRGVSRFGNNYKGLKE